MASGLARQAIASALEYDGFKLETERNRRILTQAEELLSKASMDCHSDAFHSFATALHSTLQSKFPVQEMRSKTKQTRVIGSLWGRFHHARLLELPALWEELRAKFCYESPDTMLQQHANETLFQNMLANYFDTGTRGASKVTTVQIAENCQWVCTLQTAETLFLSRQL